ncbi:MAG: hydantoinase/oxoprolinase family protein [Actinobacteria bacterium]|nr:hydantoinase/oxoprolinase family protein [Actinomycetota bacterium]
MSHDPRVLAIDAGGTMTDTFIVDQTGEFVVGKAQTTPHDESIGFMESSTDALAQWGMTSEDAFPGIAAAVFSGTAMLNRLLTRGGLKVGVIVSAGQEDCLKMERGKQTFLGYSYGDRLHVATHYHNEPLVPRGRIFGVRGRVDLNGEEVIPLREAEVREAAASLLAQEVEGIVINLIFSYRNAAHERRVIEILQEELDAKGSSIPIFASSQLYPVRGDLPRLNSALIEAYAAEPSRQTLRNVRDKTKGVGAEFELRVMAAHGGTISIETNELARTLMSGPIGGVVGGAFLAEQLDLRNVLCTDIGGTSFDIALITANRFDTSPKPDVAKFLLNIPQVSIDTVGAGTGSYVRIDPTSNRPEVGPDSAGAMIGTSWPEGGVETVTVTDLNLILGRLNPDYFLGGQVQLDTERARSEVKRQIADPLGLDPELAAAGIIELFETGLRNDAVGRILGKGYAPADYTLLCYGGGGPLHVAGYTSGIPFEKVLIPAWAAGFSAFGCACAEWEYRYDETIDLPIPPSGTDGGDRVAAVAPMNDAWSRLEKKVLAEFEKSGVPAEKVQFTWAARMQYQGQLDDIEIVSPAGRIGSDADVQAMIDEFERAYGQVYARSARSPELGYAVTDVIVMGRTEVEKPVLPHRPEVDTEATIKETRQVFWSDSFVESKVYELDDIKPGQTIVGPAVIEAAATTFPIPPKRQARLNRHDLFELQEIA